jgi:hypothetical protein
MALQNGIDDAGGAMAVLERREGGRLGFVGTIYWTGAVLRTFGGLASPLAILAMLLLALYLALLGIGGISGGRKLTECLLRDPGCSPT